mmetsp:Transcript_6653/g.20153  ORF Transcript_6653/g.20153 Transcript_6653/m.20153 type:complete len:216 (-) Transcript_6653:1983-2630(-)
MFLVLLMLFFIELLCRAIRTILYLFLCLLLVTLNFDFLSLFVVVLIVVLLLLNLLLVVLEVLKYHRPAFIAVVIFVVTASVRSLEVLLGIVVTGALVLCRIILSVDTIAAATSAASTALVATLPAFIRLLEVRDSVPLLPCGAFHGKSIKITLLASILRRINGSGLVHQPGVTPYAAFNLCRWRRVPVPVVRRRFFLCVTGVAAVTIIVVAVGVL